MNTDSTILSAYLNSIDWVREAGEHIRASLHHPFAIHTKSSDRDLVSEIDIATEQRLIQRIQAAYPEHHILAEEQHSQTPTHTPPHTEWVWIIDPIDGTSNFIKQRRDFGVMLALYHNDTPILGVVYDVIRDELLSAIYNHGVYLNGRQLQPLPSATLSSSLIVLERQGILAQDPWILDILKHSFSMRSVGSTAMVTHMLSRGGVGAFLSYKQMPWDIAAPRVILETLGIRITTLDGEIPSLQCATPCLMARAGVYEEIMALKPR